MQNRRRPIGSHGGGAAFFKPRPIVEKAIRPVVESLEQRMLLTTLTINGTSNVETIVFNGTSYTVNGGAAVNVPAGTTQVNINSQGNNDVITINKTQANVPVAVNGGTGNDTVTVGNGDLEFILAPVTVTADNFAGDNLVINDTTDNDTTTEPVSSLSASRFSQDGTEVVNFSGVKKVTINLGVNSDFVSVEETATGVPVTINTGPGGGMFELGSSQVTGNNVDHNIKAPLTINAGTGLTNVSFNNDQDEFDTRWTFAGVTATSTSGPMSVTLNGNIGAISLNMGDVNDIIDASTSNFAFEFDLRNGTNIARGGAKGDNFTLGGINDSVSGGGGNDTIDAIGTQSQNTLSGDAGNDTILGGPFKDLIEGGEGNDSLLGGDGSDFYIFNTALAAQTDVIGENVGEGSRDELNFGGLTTAVTINLASNTLATHTNRTVKTATAGDFNNIEDVFSGSGADTITGNGGSNILFGAIGNDSIRGGNGFDFIDGGLDDDKLFGEGDGDEILGNMGNDSIDGSIGDDNLDGSDGNDTLLGGADNDTIFGGSNDDVLDGGEGDDTVDGGQGADSYRFGNAVAAQIDLINESTLDPEIDTLDFSTSTSAVTVTLNSDTLATQSNRTVKTEEAGDFITIENAFGGSGLDKLTGNSLANSLNGNGSNDSLFGNDGFDTLIGGTGNDSLDGGAGEDVLGGGDGNDTLLGQGNNDFLVAGPNDDLMDGGSGNDTFFGEAGNDVYRFQPATLLELDRVSESSGIDTLDFSTITTAVNATLSFDFLVEHANREVLALVSGGFVNFENVIGGIGADSLTGNAAANSLVGNSGNDSLIGLGGNDTLLGGANGDMLDGGEGSDSLAGGLDNDVYKFANATAAQTDTLNESAGQGAFDQLDFTALTTGVTVNLVSDTIATHTNRTLKTAVAGQFAEIENVSGGSGNDSIRGNSRNNELLGYDGNDTIFGGPGNDGVFGLAGNDSVFGEDGNDYVGSGGNGDDFLDGGNNNDTVDSSVGDSGAGMTVVGGSGNDEIYGNSGLTFYRFANTSAAEADTLFTSFGDDTLDFGTVTTPVTINLGSDTLATHTNRTVKTGIAGSFIRFNNAVGGTAGDKITGNENINVINGGAGNDTLIGLDGEDSLDGGSGNDSLDGSIGDDLLTGGANDDIYKFLKPFDNEFDLIHEVAGGGTDTIDFSSFTVTVSVNLGVSALAQTLVSTVQYFLPSDASQVENAIGGSAVDILTGSAGSNKLVGNAGNDTIEGGEGSDTLEGGANDDRYVFKNATAAQTDLINESSTGGSNDNLDFTAMTVNIVVNLTSDTLATHANRTVKTFSAGQFANLEHASTGTGADSITGNAAKNFLSGGKGNDTVRGGANDDQILEENGSGDDSLFGDAGNDFLGGTIGNDVLEGGDGNDTLSGGDNNDRFVFKNPITAETDSIQDTSGTDTLDFSAFLSTAITANLGAVTTIATHINRTVNRGVSTHIFENVIGGGGNDSLTGTSGNNTLTGNGGNDTLIGLSGADSLIGNAGNDSLDGGEGSDTLDGGGNDDIYKFLTATAAQTDRITELTGGGIDSLDFSSIGTSINVNLGSDTLASHANRTIVTTAAGSFIQIEKAVGGSANDTLTGNSANNTLIGNGGADSLIGASGADSLDGSSGNDTLDGGEGNDTLVGGSNDDRYKFANATAVQTDKITELSGGGTDTLDFSLVTNSVTANLFSDTLITHTNRTVQTSSAGQFVNLENVTGGTTGDKLTGNNAKNTILGGGGNDSLFGNENDDRLEGGFGLDQLTGGLGIDQLFGQDDADTLFGSDGFVDTLDGGNGTDSLGSSDASDVKVGIP